MESGYQKAPEPLGRSGSRRLPLVVGVVTLLVGVAIVKPWAGPETLRPSAEVRPSPHGSAAPVAPPDPLAADPVWPAVSVASGPAGEAVTEAEAAVASLRVRSGTWGVGATGAGPRLVRDEPWVDWAPVAPEEVDGPPAHIAIWPGTDLCLGYPSIFDRPTVVAVTTPTRLDPARSVVGWWTDGGRVAMLTGSIREVMPNGGAGVAYLERVDRAPWPAGRYEFHLETGGRTLALTVCLARGT
jgi:hypothetical protein